MLKTASPKKIDLFSIILVAAIVAGAYYLVFHKGIAQYFYLKAQGKVLQKSLESTATVDKTIKLLQEEIKNTQVKLDEFNKRLPREKNIDEILKQISHVASLTGVHLALIEPQEIIEGRLYKRFPLKLSLKSTFKRVFLFFSQLEKLPRILQLESFTIEDKGKTDELKVEVLVSAFMLK
jgi:type IV pilus assembly protein PilO